MLWRYLTAITFSNEAGNVNTLSLLVAAIIIVPSLIKASHNGYKSEASDGITQDIFDAAWDCVDEGERGQLLLENCLVLDADDLAQKFREMGGDYTALADRSRRHEVELSATPQHALLAEHLRTIGYITRWEEKEEKIFNPTLGKETSRKFLKLRIRQVK